MLRSNPYCIAHKSIPLTTAKINSFPMPTRRLFKSCSAQGDVKIPTSIFVLNLKYIQMVRGNDFISHEGFVVLDPEYFQTTGNGYFHPCSARNSKFHDVLGATRHVCGVLPFSRRRRFSLFLLMGNCHWHWKSSPFLPRSYTCVSSRGTGEYTCCSWRSFVDPPSQVFSSAERVRQRLKVAIRNDWRSE